MHENDINQNLRELRTMLEYNTDMLSILSGQSVLNTARLETILSVLREILAKHGVDKVKSTQICGEIFEHCVAVSKAEHEKAQRSAEQSRLPSASGSDAQKN